MRKYVKKRAPLSKDARQKLSEAVERNETFGLSRVTLAAAISGDALNAPTRERIQAGLGEVGISGTTNWDGRIYSEANTKLQWERAYGSPGSQQWGEWEKLERTDHQVACALNLLSAPIRDAEPSFVLPRKLQRDDAEDAEVEQVNMLGQFVEDCLCEWLDGGLRQLLEQIVRYGLGYGFSLHEIVWDTREDERVVGGQAVYVRRMAQRLPSSLDANPWVEVDGKLHHIRQSGVKDGKWTHVDLPAEKTLLCTWNKTGSNHQGFSAFRPAWYMGFVRSELLKMMAVGAEREGLGVPVAEVDKDVVLTDDQRDKLQEVLESLVYHENAAVQLPPGVKMNWVFSGGSGNRAGLLELWKSLGVAILELVQAQQVALGTGETGSRSVGEVHNETKNAFVEGIRAWIEGGIQPLVNRLVDLNFGPQKHYPQFSLSVKKEEQSGSVQDLKALVDGGVIHPTMDDENVLRARFGLRALSQEEHESMTAAKKAAQEAAAGAFGKKAKPEGDAEDEEEPKEASDGGLTIRLD